MRCADALCAGRPAGQRQLRDQRDDPMIMRNMLLVLGFLSIITGATLSVMMSGPLSQRSAPPDPVQLRHEILVAARGIDTGTLLQLGDMAWQPAAEGMVIQGSLSRSDVDMTALVGAVARRDFAAG